MFANHHDDAETRFEMRSTTYPHNEQIKYSTHPEGSLGGPLANSSELPALISDRAGTGQETTMLVGKLNRTLRGCATLHCGENFCRDAGWDFHANALTPCNVSAAFRTRHQPRRKLHGGNNRQHSFSPRHWQLANAAGDHRLRLRDRAVELRAEIGRAHV